MTANIQEEVNHIVEIKSRATHLDNLMQGYRLYARTEGKITHSATLFTPQSLHLGSRQER